MPRPPPKKSQDSKTPLPAHRASPPPPSKGSAWSESLGGPAPAPSSQLPLPLGKPAGHHGLAMNVLPQWPPRSTQPFRRPSRFASSTTRASRPRSGGGSTQRQYLLSFPDILPPLRTWHRGRWRVACGASAILRPALVPLSSTVLSGVATAWWHPSKTCTPYADA